MTATQAIMQIMQKAAQQSNDQLLGEWVRSFVSNLRLTEDNNQSTGKKLLKD